MTLSEIVLWFRWAWYRVRKGTTSYRDWKIDRKVLKLAEEGFDTHPGYYLLSEVNITPEWIWMAAIATDLSKREISNSIQRLKEARQFRWQRKLKKQS